MRQLFFAVACLVLISCEDILPVENVDLCKGDEPASAECPQCLGATKSAGCPQCRGDAPEQGCPNVAGVSGAGNGGASGQPGMDGGSGSGGSTAGSGGFSGGSGTGSSGTGGTGGTGGSAGASESGTGGASGSGGTGGSDATVPECDEHSDCMNPNPRCLLGECVPCVNSTACTGRPEGERCDERDGSATTGQCVACIEHGHCTGAGAPQCDAATGQCVACSGDDACTGRPGTTKCDLGEGSSSLGRCVQCNSNADCPSAAAPECTNHVCGPCTSDTACTGRAGTGVCDLSGTAPYSGTCVQCTVNDEEGCGNDVCTPGTRTCAVGRARLSKDTCRPCIADSECVAEHRCIPMQFDGVDRQNAYCLRRLSATCVNPYAASPISRVSLSGAPAENYCGISEAKTSCEAIHKLIDDETCPGGEDSECGAEGSICEDVNGSPNSCTYECTISGACPGDAPCRQGYCGGPP